MAKYLVIVESPAKVKTVKKFLGSNYEVAASNGHVRDLPKSQLGIDIENDYEPKYITIRGKGELLASLRKEAKKADKVYLATDPDREGEAISWHLAVVPAVAKAAPLFCVLFCEAAWLYILPVFSPGTLHTDAPVSTTVYHRFPSAVLP